jgi:hypothetical protein
MSANRLTMPRQMMNFIAAERLGSATVGVEEAKIEGSASNPVIF